MRNPPKTTNSSKKSKTTRSSLDSFDWKTFCFFCGESCILNERRIPTKKERIRSVETIHIREKILEKCEDDTVMVNKTLIKSEIHHRMLSCFDLVAAEAIYHKNCYNDFFKNEVPLSSKSEQKMKSFDDLCDTLEFLSEPITMSDLRKQIVEKHGEENVYTSKWIKKKLKEHFGEDIYFNEDTYSTIITLKNVTSSIINDSWYNRRKGDIEEERDRIILTAAKLIYQDIRNVNFDMNFYPNVEDISDIEKGAKLIPRSLRLLLSKLVPNKIKQVGIGQCIIYAARPRSIMPTLLFGLGIELEHMYGSRWLLDELHRLGFCITYGETVRFKQSVLQKNENTVAPSYETSFV